MLADFWTGRDVRAAALETRGWCADGALGHRREEFAEISDWDCFGARVCVQCVTSIVSPAPAFRAASSIHRVVDVFPAPTRAVVSRSPEPATR